jgi:hypothetical protein
LSRAVGYRYGLPFAQAILLASRVTVLLSAFGTRAT